MTRNDRIVFVDKFAFTPSARTITPEGYMIAPARIARPGIQYYRGSDLKQASTYPSDKFNDDSVVTVYRPPSEVFRQEVVDSFKNVAVTDDHPPALLCAKTHRQYARGTVLSDVSYDNEYINATLKITDSELVEKIQRGKVEVSAGYDVWVVFEEGVAEDGVTKYDAVIKGIEGNHVAIVDKGRAGSAVKLADACTSVNPKMPKMKLMVDKDSYEIAMDSKAYYNIGNMMKDSEAEFIRENKVEKDETRGELEDEDYDDVNAGHKTKEVSPGSDMEPMVTLPSKQGVKDNDTNNHKEKNMELEKELAEVKIKLADALTAKAEAEAKADVAEAKLVDTEAKIPTSDELDEMVAERSTLVARCKSFVPELEIDGKSNFDLITAVVEAKLPQVDTDTVGEAYIQAAFDLLKVPKVEDVKPTTKSGVLDSAFEQETLQPKKKRAVDVAREAFLERSRNAHKR